MKKLLVIAFSMVSAATMYAQGTINFANGSASVNAIVKDTDATTKLDGGSGWVADAYFAPVSGPGAGVFTSAGLQIAFGTGGNAGYFFGGTQAITGQAAGVQVQIEVVVWNTANGANYAAATGKRGISTPPVTVTLGGGTVSPAQLVGLQAFNLTPEPATMAMLGLGAGALMLVRRRK